MPTSSTLLQLLSIIDCCFTVNILFCLIIYYSFGICFLIKLSLIIKSLQPMYFSSYFLHPYKATQAWLAFFIQNTSIIIEAMVHFIFFSVKLKSTIVLFRILMESLSDTQIIVDQCLSKSLWTGKTKSNNPRYLK